MALERLLEVRESGQRVPRELLDEAIALGKRGRPQEAIATCDRLSERIASTPSSGAEDVVVGAMALLQKDLSLGALGRFDAAVLAIDEALEWLEWDPETANPASAAPVLVEKARVLGELGRTDEAVAACDAALASVSDLRADQSVSMRALVFATKTVVLGKAGRVDEMPAFPEEVSRTHDESSEVMLAQAALVHGAGLSELGHGQEALGRLRGALRRLGTYTSPAAVEVSQKAHWLVARLELGACHWSAAAEAASQALSSAPGASGVVSLVARTVRAVALASMSDRPGAMTDLSAVMRALAGLDRMPKALLADLPLLAVRLGFEATLDVVEASPSADRMLPLSTALRQELGLETHVAREVEEVAQDIRRSLAELRAEETEITP